MNEVVTNKKTGNEYFIFSSDVINATNANDGQKMVAYYTANQMYVREISEFNEKFYFNK